ncbi:MAG: MATE family efflux transporter [Oscillospiraceae bacterium]|nr:MATE family efflux transporter [Oscillospiraceae bacterium]
MDIQLSDHFTTRRLIKFVFPSIIMMIFTSIYGVVDGVFVSNFCGKTALAAVNIIYPFVMVTGVAGFMFGTGGSALVGKIMGEGKREYANSLFTLLTVVTTVFGIIVSIIAIIFIEPATRLLGAEGELVPLCVEYGIILLIFQAPFMTQCFFQSFFVTAERPKLGLIVIVAAGLTNIVGDAVLVGALDWGIWGAGIATGLSQVVGGVLPFFYFASKKNTSALHFRKFNFEIKPLIKSAGNGLSELMTNVSMNLVSMLYNLELLKIAGEDGIAVYCVMLYLNFVFVAMFIGFTMGSAPIVSFHYGAKNHAELHNLFKKSFVIVALFGAFVVLFAEVCAVPLSKIFVGYDERLMAMTVHGLRIYALSFLVNGINIYASSFFTALNNGLISGLLSFLRTCAFQVVAVLILPIYFGLDGVWMSVCIAELIAFVISMIFFVTQRKRYNY